MAQKLLGFFLLLGLLIAPGVYTDPAHADWAQRVERAQFGWHLVEDKGALLVDLRDRRPYRNGHLRQAINLPLADIVSDSLDMGQDKTRFMVLYGDDDLRLGDVHKLMVKKGFTNVFYAGSYEDMRVNRPDVYSR